MTNVESVGSGRFGRVASVLPHLCILLVFVAICVGLKKTQSSDGSFCHVTSFCDARVYVRAIDAYRAGADPYAPGLHGMDFVYPPIFLRVGGFFADVQPGEIGWHLYGVFLFLGICSISWALTKFIRSEWLSPVGIGILFILVPKFYTEQAFMFGNIATICYACLLVAAIPGVWRNRWHWFYLAIFFAALVKPPFLTLLILPWLGGTRQFWRSAGTALLVAAGYLTQRTADRQLFTGFLDCVHRQLVVYRDAGIGALAVFYKVSDKVPLVGEKLVFCGTAGLILAIVLCLAWLRQFRTLPGIERLWPPTLLVASIVSNPRMAYYDAYIAFVPAVFLFAQWAIGLPPTRFRYIWIVLPIAVCAAVFKVGPATGIFLFIFISLVLTIYRMVTESFAAIKQESLVRTPTGPQGAAR